MAWVAGMSALLGAGRMTENVSSMRTPAPSPSAAEPDRGASVPGCGAARSDWMARDAVATASISCSGSRIGAMLRFAARSDSQSTGVPSLIDSVRRRRVASSSARMDRLPEPDERPRHEHARRVRRGVAKRLGDLLEGEPHLDSHDDRLLLLFGKSRQRRLVLRERLGADRSLQWGGRLVRLILAEILVARFAPHAPDLVENLVPKDRAEVGQERSLPP